MKPEPVKARSPTSHTTRVQTVELVMDPSSFPESRLAVINVHSGTLSLELIDICDASTNGSGSSQFSAAEKDDLGFHPQQQVDSVL